VRFSDSPASPCSLALAECRGEAHIYATVEVRRKEEPTGDNARKVSNWETGRETRMGVEEGRRVPPPPPPAIESREAAPLPVEQALGSRCQLNQPDCLSSRALVLPPEPSPSLASSSPSNSSSITLKVYAKCLGPDIEYKTVMVGENMSSRELVWLLLSKYRMRHRDPKLFYLTMDVTVRKTGIPIKRTMVLEDDARPAKLRSCNPWGETKFSLQMRKGGLVRVYDSVLVEELNYKAILISEETTVEDVIRILLNCYGLEQMEEVSRFCVFEIGERRERKLNRNEKPLAVQSHWSSSSSSYQRFVLRRATRSVSNQFPEETCVDDNSALYCSYSSTDSSSSTCSEVEHAFLPRHPSSTPRHPSATPTAFSSSLPLSTLLSLSRPHPTSLSDPSRGRSTSSDQSRGRSTSLSDPSLPSDPLSSSQGRALRIIKGPSFGSVSSDSNLSESEHFFYI